jgi:G3E family GTPase
LNPAARQVDVAQRPGASKAAEPAWWLENSTADSFRTSAQWIARAGAGTLRRSAGAGFSLAGSGNSSGNDSGNARPSAPTHATSFCMSFERPIEWVTFTLWLTLLVHRHGDRLLRIKGLLDIEADGDGHSQPTVLHGIGHLMHPPEHLDTWPDADRRSRLVFITQGLSEETVTKSWRDFDGFYAMDETA